MSLSSSRLISKTAMSYRVLELDENGQLRLKRVIEQTASVSTKEGSRLDLITILKESEIINHQLLRDTSKSEKAPLHRSVHDFAAESSQQNAVQKPSQAAAVVFEANEAATNTIYKPTEAAVANAAQKKRSDGRIHSHPHNKNGPYTCPKCKGVYATSQLFAAHTKSIHYKFESKGERWKRLTARYCKRNPRVEMVNDKPTIVWGNKNKGIVAPPPSSPPHPPVRVFVKSECVEELPPLPGFDKLIPPPPGFGNPIAPARLQNPIPPLGFRTPPPGFENYVPGFPLSSRFRRSTAVAPRDLLLFH